MSCWGITIYGAIMWVVDTQHSRLYLSLAQSSPLQQSWEMACLRMHQNYTKTEVKHCWYSVHHYSTITSKFIPSVSSPRVMHEREQQHLREHGTHEIALARMCTNKRHLHLRLSLFYKSYKVKGSTCVSIFDQWLLWSGSRPAVIVQTWSRGCQLYNRKKHWTRLMTARNYQSWLCRRYGTVRQYTSHWRSLMHDALVISSDLCIVSEMWH